MENPCREQARSQWSQPGLEKTTTAQDSAVMAAHGPDKAFGSRFRRWGLGMAVEEFFVDWAACAGAFLHRRGFHKLGLKISGAKIDHLKR